MKKIYIVYSEVFEKNSIKISKKFAEYGYKKPYSLNNLLHRVMNGFNHPINLKMQNH